jgi:hypothetical protein
MDLKKILIGTIVGGIVLFLAGGLIWGMLLEPIIKNHTTQYDGIMKAQEAGMPFIAISCLASALLISLVFNRWASISTAKTGASAGAVIAILLGIIADSMVLGQYELIDTPVLLMNIVGNAIWGAIGGAVIGWLMGR